MSQEEIPSLPSRLQTRRNKSISFINYLVQWVMTLGAGRANDPFIGVEYQLSFISYLYIMIHKGSTITGIR